MPFCQEYTYEGEWFGYKRFAPYVATIIKKDDQKVNVVMEVDSGASISLLPRSFADVLGLDLESGQKITLVGVGGKAVDAYVHRLDIEFGDITLTDIPVAFASTDVEIPALLGRLGVYERTDILMDNLNDYRAPAVCIGESAKPLPPVYQMETTSIGGILFFLFCIVMIFYWGESNA